MLNTTRNQDPANFNINLRDEEQVKEWIYSKDVYNGIEISIIFSEHHSQFILDHIKVFHQNPNNFQYLVSYITHQTPNNFIIRFQDINTFRNDRNHINHFFEKQRLIDKTEGGVVSLRTILEIFEPEQNQPILNILSTELKKFFTSQIKVIPDKRFFLPKDGISGAMNKELAVNGNNLVTLLYKKRNLNENDWIENFNNELISFIPDIEELRQTVDQRDNTTLLLKEKELLAELELENMGAGVLNIAHFIAFIMEMAPDTILCIEEPELHLHPGLEIKLRNKLLEISKTNQIFITTHSREFLYEDESECSVYLLQKDNNHSAVNKIPEENYEEIYEELDIDIDKYKLQQNFLYNEEILKQFIEKVMEPNRIEDDLWDFKQTLHFWEVNGKAEKIKAKIKFCNQVASFANFSGGLLIVGITDEDPKQIIGIKNLEEKVKQIKKVLREFTKSRFDFIKCKDIVLRDTADTEKSCLIIAIKQTKAPILVRQLDGNYICKIRNNTEADTETYENILKMKETIPKDNLDFFNNLIQLVR
jgi:predicted ATPase